MRNRDRIRGLLLMLTTPFILLMSMSCTTGPQNGNNPPAPGDAPPAAAEKLPRRVTLKSLLADSAAYAGQTVIVEGAFRGWQGPCPSSVSVTRSDWVLDDGTGCIYVSGQMPATLSAFAPRGERVSVTGKVMTAGDGKLNLQAVTVRVLSNSPDDAFRQRTP